ncbi:MAG: phage baseplate assembly protein V [Desulfovibrionaceae bacterium]
MSNDLWSRVDARISRALASVRQGFRAVLTGINTAPGVQLLQADALSGEQLQASELVQHFGFTSAPPPGTQCIVLPLGGKSSHSIIIGTEHGSYRVAALQSGEVAVYNQSGAKIVLKDQKVIEIDCRELRITAEESVTVNAQTVAVNASAHLDLRSPDLDLGGEGGAGSARMHGDLQITGTSTADTDHVSGDISLVHHHHEGTGEPIF